MPASEPIGEDRRVALLNRLTETLGEEEARTLMESLPPVLWTHLATKDDLLASEERLRTEFNGQFAMLSAGIKNEFAGIKNEFAGIKNEFAGIKGEFAGVAGEFAGVKGEFAKIHARMDRSEAMTAAEFKSMRAETALQLAKQNRTMVITLIGFAITVWITLLATGLS